MDKFVVLAFDNVYDLDGTYRGAGENRTDKVYTTIYVSNEIVRKLADENPRILFGLSVHPFRPDALEELEKHQEKAVLCKWIASSHMIDMSIENEEAQEKLRKFFEKLVEYKLPLLYHTGVETSIPTSDKRYEQFNAPKYIEKALDMGVTVILAHCGCSYFDILQDNVVKEVLAYFDKQKEEGKDWNLYADISALFSPFRQKKILDMIFKKMEPSQLIYGSDFPNPSKGRKESFLRILWRFGRANLFNRNFSNARKGLEKYYTKEQYNEIFTNFHGLLNKLGRGHLIDGD